MLVIRLFRAGKKNQPFFKIVVTDKRKPPRAGRFIEELGNWNPLKKEKILKGDRIKYWLSVGAKPSPTIFNLLVSEKIVEGKKIPVHKKSKKKETPTETPTPAEKPKEDLSSDSSAEAQGAKAEASKEAKEEKPKEEVPKEEKKAAPTGGEPRPESSGREEVVKESPKEDAKPEEVK